MLVAIDRGFGGFRLSIQAQKKIAEKKGIDVYCYGVRFITGKAVYNPKSDEDGGIYFCNKYLGDNPCVDEVLNKDNLINLRFDKSQDRTDKDLIETINELGANVNARYSDIKLVQVPDSINYEIWEIEGPEVIVQKGHYWR